MSAEIAASFLKGLTSKGRIAIMFGGAAETWDRTAKGTTQNRALMSDCNYIDVPAFCMNCQTIFPSGVRIGSKAGHANVPRNRDCPTCEEPATVATRLLTTTVDAIAVVSGPDSTRAKIEALQALTEKLRAAKITKQEAVKQAEAIAPRYGEIIDAFASQGLSALALLVGMLRLHLQWEGNKSSSEFEEQLLGAVNKQTFVLKDISDNRSNARKTAAPANEKPKSKARALKDGRHRRVGVRKERRHNLIEKRREFGGARRR